jgi:hypothetical protein
MLDNVKVNGQPETTSQVCWNWLCKKRDRDLNKNETEREQKGKKSKRKGGIGKAGKGTG